MGGTPHGAMAYKVTLHNFIPKPILVTRGEALTVDEEPVRPPDWLTHRRARYLDPPHAP
jgi:hypothetical protein